MKKDPDTLGYTVLSFMVELLAVADGYTLEVVLSNIHYYRCHNHIQLIALSNILHQTITSINSKVSRIILIDFEVI